MHAWDDGTVSLWAGSAWRLERTGTVEVEAQVDCKLKHDRHRLTMRRSSMFPGDPDGASCSASQRRWLRTLWQRQWQTRYCRDLLQARIKIWGSIIIDFYELQKEFWLMWLCIFLFECDTERYMLRTVIVYSSRDSLDTVVQGVSTVEQHFSVSVLVSS